METKLVLVTPAMAIDLLKENKSNRNTRQSAVKKYASDMKKGLWKESHQGIAIYDDGNIADGQHRLQAIIASGVSLEMLVTTGIKKQAGAYIDTHKPRSMIDCIDISGMSDWIKRHHISTIRAIVDIFSPGGCASSAMPINDVVDMCAKYKDELDFCFRSCQSKKRGLSSAVLYAQIVLAAQTEDRKRLEKFCEIYQSGICESPHDVAALKIRDYSIEYFAKTGNGSSERKEFGLKIQWAIDAFLKKQNVKRMSTLKEFLYTPLR